VGEKTFAEVSKLVTNEAETEQDKETKVETTKTKSK
jgi:hypothetical protein